MQEVGTEVKNVNVGDFVVGSFVISYNTCETCRASFQSKGVRARFANAVAGTQMERPRMVLADGTLVATPGRPDTELIPSLMAASDVLGTGWFAAVAAEAGPMNAGNTIQMLKSPGQPSRAVDGSVA